MLNYILLGCILLTNLYLVWRAKDSHWHSQAEWEVMNKIADRQIRYYDHGERMS